MVRLNTCVGMLLMLLVSIPLSAQIRFEKLDNRDGLSNNRINSIYMDQLGFMWFGTVSGINRYDGTEVKVIQYDESDPFAPTNPNITFLREGPGGYIWIKTSYGVFAYDIYQETFINITDLLCDLDINNYNLRDIVKDETGNYWFVIDEVGVKKFITETNAIISFPKDYLNVTSAQPDNHGNMVLLHQNGQLERISLNDPAKRSKVSYPKPLHGIKGLKAEIDKDGDFWFYSTDDPFGLAYYQPETGEYRLMGEKELGSNLVSGVIEDELFRIIIGADHGGLTFITKQDWKRQQFHHNPLDPKSLSNNGIISMYQDQTGLLWFGTNKGGVNYYSPKTVTFHFYKQSENVSSNTNDILPMVEAGDGNLWIGTDGGGLTYLDLESEKFVNYTHDPDDPTTISSDIVVSMSKAANGGLWLGTYLGGLNYFDGKNFNHYQADPNDPNAISDNSIWKLFLDSHKNLWVGTLKAGIDVYAPGFKKIRHFGLENGSINSNYVTSFAEDRDGKIWIGTGYGIELFDPADSSFTHILKEDGNPNSLTNNSILDIYCDHHNDIWVATIYGLNRIDQATGKFYRYTKKTGLPDDIIASILEDCEGNIWLGSYKGMTKLVNPRGQASLVNFDISDGLQGDTFNERSALRLSNGTLAFGGKNGLNVFNPSEIKLTDEFKKLVFLDFYISNRVIRPGEMYNGRIWFEQGLNAADHLTLKPNENSFTFEFTTLDFYDQENTIYQYRLKGFDEDWIVRSNIHRANYTNLDPGTYRFEVMDRSHPNFSQLIAMDITILTPWWRTPAAIIFYVMAGIVILLLTRRSIIRKERYRARVNQEKLESQRLHELDLMKIKFFTNISHEFRTPLTLILNPLDKLLKMTDDAGYRKHVELVHRNAKRLLTLTNQLLDFRKIEANQHRMSIASGDLVDFLKSIIDSFSDLSADRRIRLEFSADPEEFLTFFDRDKFEKVMYNLLSNGFKFTNPGGKIVVSLKEVAVEEEVHSIRITVEDTGIGIPVDRLDDVFTRFFQVDNEQNTVKNIGSGIGLAITREFIDMHGGKIWVESKLEEGSTFIIELPMKKLPGGEDNDESQWLDEDRAVDPHQHQHSKDTILLADDNTDFRFYLKDNLKEIYNVYEVPNGKTAWKKVMSQLPDLVVTDIMMPEMNGIELCRKIKNDPRTAHIPVILLTAHYSDDQKLEGYEAGAIEYITKPFNFEILIRAIHSAMQFQKLIHASEHRMDPRPAEIEITSRDEQFIKKAIELVETNIANAEFSVQELSRELAVSRGQLYKKTLEMTGKTPIEFIRSIRIRRAADLLEKSQLNVAEVAYHVGFNNPKYFTKYFKKEFKTLPSKYGKAGLRP